MTRPKKLTQSVVDTALALKKQGITRREIATRLGISYTSISKLFGQERLGIDRSKKEPWTIENLIKLRDNYMNLPPRDICLMFNRDRYEIRLLLAHLGWEIPDTYFNRDRKALIEKVKELKDNYNQSQIAVMLGVPTSTIQALCSSESIKCSGKRCSAGTAEDFMKNQYKSLADSIKQRELKRIKDEEERKSK